MLMSRTFRYTEAHDAADKALAADPTSVKARYRRGLARKHLEMWTAADIGMILSVHPHLHLTKADNRFPYSSYS